MGIVELGCLRKGQVITLITEIIVHNNINDWLIEIVEILSSLCI